MTKPPFDPLLALVRDELARPAPSAAAAFVAPILERHADAVAAVLFYGSCLRKGTSEGVLDFYVLVDDYRAAHRGWLPAFANAVLPPNVYTLSVASPARLGQPAPGTSEGHDDTEPLRCKYAVVSLRDFDHLVSERASHPYIWARFAQPSLLTYVRDSETRARIEACAAEAIVTFVRRLVVFLPARGALLRFSYSAFWQLALARTYGSELRSEGPDSVRQVYDADPERYAHATTAALERLAAAGDLDGVETHAQAATVKLQPALSRRMRWRWRLLRPWSKALAVARLLKTAFTFGDWVPYILWKVERHSGQTVELGPLARRHPLVFGWPAILRLLWKGGAR